ncbi:Ig-like domain-containing protein [Pseudoalteromonas sp. SSDWG2]|uniref:Ig-like domain-containing protein n=1 Tax=Pseudoalteromonas sp. SSDWG2 TaxID=3139391 RepID=UPI003BAC4A39
MRSILRTETSTNTTSSAGKACALFALTLGLAFTTMQVQATPVNAAESESNNVKLQTLELASMAAALNAAHEQHDAKAQLVKLAQQRYANQFELLERDPSAVLRTILPQAKRNQLRAVSGDAMAKKASITGTLELVYQDAYESENDRLRYFLKSASQHTELFLPESARAQQLRSGQTLRASGWQFTQGHTSRLLLEQDSNALEVLAVGESSATSSSSSASVLSGTTGEQKVVVLALNFQDNPSLQPWTTQEVHDMVFGRVNDYYQEASYGQTWLTGDVFGYFTLALNTTCDFSIIEQYAVQAAVDNGVDLNQYQRRVYMLPKNSACSWLGQGTIGGTPSTSWINGELNLKIIGHELGHNLGLRHAKRLNCGFDIYDEQCLVSNYGDSLDVMGKSEGHFNVLNKERLGWLSAQSGDIIAIDADGQYTLESYATAKAGQAKGLKVRRGTDATTSEPLWYYLEYRQAQGFDSFLAGKAVTNGVLMHYNTAAEHIDSSILMDLTPYSSLFDNDDAALEVGQTFVDATAGISVTTQWADENAANVSVSFSAPSCVASAPTLSIAPTTSAWVAPGTQVNVNATVTNNDSLECEAASFLVSTAVPANWSAASEFVNLAPGQSATVSLSVISDVQATDGFYDLTVSVVNNNDNQHSAQSVFSYVVEAPQPLCELAAPSWVLVNNNSGVVDAGVTVVYEGVLTNNNSDVCEQTSFDVLANLPVGFNADTQTISLLSGESQSVSVAVTSSTNTNAGVYDFSIQAHNATDALYQSAASATYTIAEPAPVCELGAPAVNVQSIEGFVNAGEEQIYTVSVTNQNLNCDDATYSLTVMTPQGWYASTANITLANGQTANTTVTVASVIDANAGSYSLLLTAKDVNNANIRTDASLSYNIQEQVNHAPIAMSDSIAISAKAATVFNVLVNDVDEDGDVLTITSVTQGAKGTVSITADGQIEYTPAKSFKSSDSFSYTISDGEFESTTTVTISLSSTDSGSTDDSGSTGGTKKGRGGK